MDRRIIIAVAGSGKTTFLINKLDLEKRFLVVTYTDNNVAHLRRSIIDRFGYMPTKITLLSYFQFLLQVCYRPFLKDKYKAKGITWNMPDPNTRKLKRSDPLFYLTRNGYLYHNRIAKLCQSCSNLIKDRLEKFYDCFLFDEVQDLGGHDFDLIQSIAPTKIDCIFVGDFYQHTYDTSNDGNINSGLYKVIKNYMKIWNDNGINVDLKSLSNSYRCSQTTCDFVRNNLKIPIYSFRSNTTRIIDVNNQSDADALFSYLFPPPTINCSCCKGSISFDITKSFL